MVGAVAADVLSPHLLTAWFPFVTLDFFNIPVSLEIRVVEVGDGSGFILTAQVDGIGWALVAFVVDVVGGGVCGIVVFVHFQALLVAI